MTDSLGEGVTIQQGEDHIIPAVRADQTMSVLACSVCLTINSFCEDGDIKRGQSLFAVFVYQLAKLSKEPEMIAKLLRCVADEMDAGAEKAS